MQFLPKEKDAIKKILFARLDELGPGEKNHRVEIYDASRALDESSDIKAWLDLGTASLDGETYDKIKAVLDDILFAATFTIFVTFGRDVFAGYSKIGLVVAELFWLAWQNEVKHLETPPNLKPHPAHITPAFERLCAFVDPAYGVGIAFREGGNVSLFGIREMAEIPALHIKGSLKLMGVGWFDADFWNPKTQTEANRENIWRAVHVVRNIIAQCFALKPALGGRIQKTTLSPLWESYILRRVVLVVPPGKMLTRLQVLGYCLLSGASQHLEKPPLQLLSATLKLTPQEGLRWSHENKVLQVTVDDSGLGGVMYQEDNQQCFKTFQAPIEPLLRACECDYPLAYDQRMWNDTTRTMAEMIGGCVLEVKRALASQKTTEVHVARGEGIMISLDSTTFEHLLKHAKLFVNGKSIDLNALRKDI